MSTHLFLNWKNEKLWSIGFHQRNGGKSLYQGIKNTKLSSFSFSLQPLCIIFIYIAKTWQNMTRNGKVLNPEFQRLYISMLSSSQGESVPCLIQPLVTTGTPGCSLACRHIVLTFASFYISSSCIIFLCLCPQKTLAIFRA